MFAAPNNSTGVSKKKKTKSSRNYSPFAIRRVRNDLFTAYTRSIFFSNTIPHPLYWFLGRLKENKKHTLRGRKKGVRDVSIAKSGDEDRLVGGAVRL